MNQDEIIEIAQECKLIGMRPHLDGIYTEALEAFAKLVAAKEREACAKVIENYPHWIGKTAKTEISNAIRARTEDKND